MLNRFAWHEHLTDKEGFFLRHTAHLPSSTSQLVLFHHLFCIHIWGSTSMFTSGGPPPCSLLGGSHFCVHFWGVHFHIHFWGGSTFMFTSRGVHFHVHMFTSGGSPLLVHFQGVHFHVHFWGVPCDLSHNALIYCYRTPQCIIGKIHMGPPQSWTDWLTDKHNWKHYLPTYYVCGW